MSTICDIDSIGSECDASASKFVALLRAVALEHECLRREYERLLVAKEHGIAKDCQGTKSFSDLAPCVSDHEYKKNLPDVSSSNAADTTSTQHVLLATQTSCDDQQDLSQQATDPAQSIQLSQPSSKATLHSFQDSQPSSASLDSGSEAVVHRFRLHELWVCSIESLALIHGSSNRSLGLKLNSKMTRGGDSLRDATCMQRLIIGPNTLKRTLWDLFGLLILSIDMVMVPLVAFDIPDTPPWQVLNLSCTVFWTLDIVMSFLTGFHVEGVIEMRPSKVMKQYLQSWFVLDIIVVTFDWFLFVSTSDLSEFVGLLRASKFLRFARVFRALRFARLLRAFKIPGLIGDVADSVKSERISSTVRVFSSILALAVANHFIACGFYAVGKVSKPSWNSDLEDENRSLAYKYATALHWSLTQFTPAAMEVHPRSFPERVYSICVLFVALVVFSSFVSSITHSMNELRKLNESTAQQKKKLRRYISENRVSLDLGNRVRAFAKHLRVRSKKRVHEDEVDAFRALPESLRLQLHWEVYVPDFCVHPLFFHLAQHCEPFVLKLCHTSLSEKSLMTSQELFGQGDDATRMYFAVSGCLEYYRGNDDIPIAMVDEAQWCCEVALWLHWIHKGQLVGLSHCELFALDCKKFRNLASQELSLFKICRTYALSFQEWLAGLRPDQAFDVLYDHDAALEFAHLASFPMSDVSKTQVFAKRSGSASWRTWHTFKIMSRKLTAFEFKIQRRPHR